MKRFFLWIAILLCTIGAGAQDYELPYGSIVLDSFTVTAMRDGLDIADLIHIMQYDSTLYIAFNNLHFTPYTYRSSATAFDKDKAVEAWRKETVRQTWDGTCREQFIDELSSEGEFENRRGKQHYYTLELFNRTFYDEGRICGEKRQTNWQEILYSDKKEGHVGAIKKVVFNPGTAVNLPLIGKKFALFDDDMMPYYEYAINGRNIDGYDCYVFTIRVRPEHADSRRDVIVRELVTAFRTSDFQIIRRDYRLRYTGGVVKVDITMQIGLQEHQGRFYPAAFHYNGSWKVPTKKLEDLDLQTVFVVP